LYEQKTGVSGVPHGCRFVITPNSHLLRQITFSVSTKNLAQPLAGKIGIITPTKAQITCLKAALTQWLLYWTECSIDDIIIGTQDDFVG
jgi:hypothetical protein